MKGIKLTILILAEVVCIIAFVALCRNTVTKQSLLPAARYKKNPTNENRILTKKAKRNEQHFLWTVRAGISLALVYNSWGLTRVIQGNKSSGIIS